MIKTFILSFLLLPLALVGPGTRADDLKTASAPYTDFQDRVKSAIQRRDFALVRGLYKTNDIKGDLDPRWQHIFDLEGRESVSFYFKELDQLPPEARAYWSRAASRLTKDHATHLGMIVYGSSVRLELPLVIVNGVFLIAPYDKQNGDKRIDPGGPASGSQPSPTKPR
jgi:hypothetical protein